MTTPAGKYKFYSEDCPKEEYDLDEKEYLIKIREIVGGTQSWDEIMSQLGAKIEPLGLALVKDTDITDEEYRYYWLLCPISSQLREYRIVEKEALNQFKETK